MEYKYQNKLLLNGWAACGTILQRYIRDLKYGRQSEIDTSYKKFRVLYESLITMDNFAPCNESPFVFKINDRVLVIGQSPVVITSEYLEDETCPCGTNCLTDAQIDTVEENIIEIGKTC